MRPLHLASLLLALALAGCVTTVSVPSAHQQEQGQQARHLFDQGQYRQAAEAYARLASQYREADDYFRLRAAEAWREAGDREQMARTLSQVHRERLQAGDARHYDLLQAELALQAGDAARALQLVGGTLDAVPPALRGRALELRARAQAGSGQRWEAARTRVELNEQLGADRRGQNREHILTLLADLGAPALQQRIDTLTRDDPMLPWLVEALNRLGVSMAPVTPELTRPVGTLVGTGEHAEGYRMPRQVALVLPLSGPVAAAGEAVRQGFLSAYFQSAGHASDLPPVKVYDTRGTAGGAVAAYRQAVADGATRVVGPLMRAGVGAVLGQDPLPVPLLALNHPDTDGLPPPGVTEFALRPEAEGVQVADHMRELGLHRAVVLVGADDASSRAAKAFAARFTAQGGQVADTVNLDAGSVNYGAILKGLGLGDADPYASGIFLAMRAPQARLLMPQIRLAGSRLPVFATSRVYEGRDDPVADNDLDGVTFCDAPWLFDAQPGLPPRTAMAAALPTARGSSGRLFAFGMDAWSLVPYLDWLREHPGRYLPGASGRLTEDDFGRVHRVLTWARFQNGVARPQDGSLEMDAPAIEQTPDMPPPADDGTAPAEAGSVHNIDIY